MSSLPHQLPNLNSIRFFAAVAVIIAHVELVKKSYNLINIQNSLGFLGDWGVNFFFSLSGFLITYLLILEKNKNKSIQIKHFYFRRIFRIWPLYYWILALSVLLSFILINKSPLIADFNLKALVYNILLLPQIAKSYIHQSFSSAVLWSIGVEELFYLFFPLLFISLKSKPIFKLSIGIAILLLAKICIMPLCYKLLGAEASKAPINLISMTRFEIMLTGSLFAFWASQNITYINSKLMCFWIGLAGLFFFSSFSFLPKLYAPENAWGPILISVLIPFFLSVFMSVILSYLAFSSKLKFALSNRFLDFGGKISYGLYVYHPLVLILISYLFPTLLKSSVPGLFLLITLLITILISALSYEYFEKPFLKVSSKYRHI